MDVLLNFIATLFGDALSHGSGIPSFGEGIALVSGFWANDEVHRHLDLVVSAVEMRFKLVGQVIGCYMDAKLMCFC